jgi:hypothetical protein
MDFHNTIRHRETSVSHDELIRRFIESGQRAQAAVNFEIAKAELRRFGIILTARPGEYQVNLTGGPDAMALTAETLDEAVQLGIDIAKTFPPATPAHIAAKIPPGKVLTGKDALDLAKAIAQDPQVNARPENREALDQLAQCIAAATAAASKTHRRARRMTPKAQRRRRIRAHNRRVRARVIHMGAAQRRKEALPENGARERRDFEPGVARPRLLIRGRISGTDPLQPWAVPGCLKLAQS